MSQNRLTSLEVLNNKFIDKQIISRNLSFHLSGYKVYNVGDGKSGKS